MEKIVNINQVDSSNFQLQNYSFEEESLISSTESEVAFDPNEDYIEYYIFDLNKNIIASNIYGFPNYEILNNNIVVNPQQDLESFGYSVGQYYTLYNFLKKRIASSPSETFYIQDISSNRTELRLNTNIISEDTVASLGLALENQINSPEVNYTDFYLNFGENKLIIAINAVLETSLDSEASRSSILIKLYEPLPSEFDFYSQCWIVEKIADSIAYNIDITLSIPSGETLPYINGPNFNLNIQDQINNSTPYYSQNSLQQNTSLLGSGSLLYQINSILSEKGIELNIDYSDYANFIHFSSAKTRLENFYYKLSLIEQYSYNSNIALSSSINSYISSSQNVWNNKINEIITNFDGYEYYLYFNSESKSWPKSNSLPPYLNYSTNSPIAIDWLTNQLTSASYFDTENKDELTNTIPTYLRDDSNNDSYSLFVQMMGQHFDNVWIYLKDITNKFDTDNRLEYGISKDIVAQAIRDLGVKIYQNNFSTGDLYSSLLGFTISGSNLNIPNITGSLPIPTGSGLEYINTIVTASSPNALEPLDDINKEIYKRIYHNLPVLLRKKGTPEGLRILMNIYGIPDTILRINEFGGKSTTGSNTWDNFVDQFNYEFFTTSSGYVEVPILISTGSGGGMYGSALYGGDFYGGDSFNGGK